MRKQRTPIIMNENNDIAARPHGDDHMLKRNELSQTEYGPSPKKEPETENSEDSSTETNYKDSSLIESFHNQSTLQESDEMAINRENLNREPKTPLDPYAEVKRVLAEMEPGEPISKEREEWIREQIHQVEGIEKIQKQHKCNTHEKGPGDDPCSCMPARATCWEESQRTWKEHILFCARCSEWTFHVCKKHGHSNLYIAHIYERISQSLGHRMCNGQLGHANNCTCIYYPSFGGCLHQEIHWTTCYEDGCEIHMLNKRVSQ